MAGLGLELFKFALYLTLPVAAMVQYGKPEWYTQHVLPVSILESPPTMVSAQLHQTQYKDRIFPRIENTHRVPIPLFESHVIHLVDTEPRISRSTRLLSKSDWQV